MKRLVLIGLLFLAAPSFAAKGGEGGNTNCNGVGNANSPCIPDTTTDTQNGGTIYDNTSNNIINNTSNNNINNSYNAGDATATASSLAAGIGSAQSQSVGTFSNTTSNSTSVNNTISGSSGGGGTTTNNTTLNYPRQAPAAVAPNVAVQGNNGFSGGISTPFGGISFGSSNVDGSVRALNRATADGIYIDNLLKLKDCDTDECDIVIKFILRRFK